METTLKLQGYNGEIITEHDGVDNRGAAWYSSYFNEKKLRILQDPKRENKSETIPSVEMEFSARKWHNSDTYEPRFTTENLSVENNVGIGKYSEVWKARLGNSDIVALKQLNVKKVQADMIWKERDMLMYLRNRRICNILGAFFDQDAFIVLELCFSNLKHVMFQVNNKNALRFGIQLAEALNWCHGKNIVHCNLNPENCLVTTSNNLVLSSFGRATLIPESFTDVKASESLGIPPYQDLASTTEYTYSRSSDMFSFGCVFFELLTKRCLIQYGISEVPVEEYVRVHTEGRLKSLQTWPPTNSLRETLEERVTRFAIEYGPVILGLINERSKRWTATKFLNCDNIHVHLTKAGISLDTLDNDASDMVTIEYQCEEAEPFSLKNEDSIDEVVIAFHGFYYDEKEAFNGKVVRKAVHSYEAHVIAEFLSKSNGVPHLMYGLEQNDPVSNAQLLNLVKKWLRLEPESKFESNFTIGCSPNKETDPFVANGQPARSINAASNLKTEKQNYQVTVEDKWKHQGMKRVATTTENFGLMNNDFDDLLGTAPKFAQSSGTITDNSVKPNDTEPMTASALDNTASSPQNAKLNTESKIKGIKPRDCVTLHYMKTNEPNDDILVGVDFHMTPKCTKNFDKLDTRKSYQMKNSTSALRCSPRSENQLCMQSHCKLTTPTKTRHPVASLKDETASHQAPSIKSKSPDGSLSTGHQLWSSLTSFKQTKLSSFFDKVTGPVKRCSATKGPPNLWDTPNEYHSIIYSSSPDSDLSSTSKTIDLWKCPFCPEMNSDKEHMTVHIQTCAKNPEKIQIIECGDLK